MERLHQKLKLLKVQGIIQHFLGFCNPEIIINKLFPEILKVSLFKKEKILIYKKSNN